MEKGKIVVTVRAYQGGQPVKLLNSMPDSMQRKYFTIGLVNYVLQLLTWQMIFFNEF